MSHRSKPSITTLILDSNGYISGAYVSEKANYSSPVARAKAFEFGSKGDAEEVRAKIEEGLAEQSAIEDEIQRLKEKLDRKRHNLLRGMEVQYKDNELNLRENRPIGSEAQKVLDELKSKLDDALYSMEKAGH